MPTDRYVYSLVMLLTVVPFLDCLLVSVPSPVTVVSQAIGHTKNKYTDAFTSLLEALFLDFNFDEAQKHITSISEVSLVTFMHFGFARLVLALRASCPRSNLCCLLPFSLLLQPLFAVCRHIELIAFFNLVSGWW